MVNTEEFTIRLNKIMEYYDLSAASFADKIDVGRSSISHLLSGRNKPSLDFVMKIINAFPEVELYWLLNGKGSFPGKHSGDPQKEKAPNVRAEVQDLFTPAPLTSVSEKNNSPAGKEIRKIIVLYADGSFEAYEN
ncbi:helix-turn-helix domain-containing protein [Salinimicrobium xinjiangense]|uniref:helix-turn-helix domain-containing protein n=1 Tax=Salinimicrobium xinjiangense TaxID=438596 RepID=UPI000406AAF6|nr:helix-turn-helix transcriptional regulator [Salinimicrobium xinjiangense]